MRGATRIRAAKLAVTTALAAGLLLALAGSAQAAILTPNGDVFFPDTRVGQKTSMVFTLRIENELSHSVKVGTASSDGPGFVGGSFSQTNNCPSTLTPANPSCTITVTFAPTKPGRVDGTLGTGSGDIRTQARLAGEGIGAPKKKKCKKGKGKAGAAKKGNKCKKKKGTGTALLAISPTSHNFGPQLPLSSTPFTFTVTNAGNAPTGLLSGEVSGGSGTFQVGAPNDCTGSSLPPGRSCKLTVRFSPSVAGPQTGTLNVSGTPGGSVSATLSGNSFM